MVKTKSNSSTRWCCLTQMYSAQTYCFLKSHSAAPTVLISLLLSMDTAVRVHLMVFQVVLHWPCPLNTPLPNHPTPPPTSANPYFAAPALAGKLGSLAQAGNYHSATLQIPPVRTQRPSCWETVGGVLSLRTESKGAFIIY